MILSHRGSKPHHEEKAKMIVGEKPTRPPWPPGTVVTIRGEAPRILYVVDNWTQLNNWVPVRMLTGNRLSSEFYWASPATMEPDFFLTEVLSHKGYKPNNVIENKEEKV